MKVRNVLCGLVLSAACFLPVQAMAGAKDYQVTGPVLAIEDNVVTIQKGDEKWQIDITTDTKVEGKLAVGEKVTIHYHMVADKIDKKSEKKEK